MAESPERIDWGARAQEAAEKHLSACYDAWEVESEGEEAEWPADLSAPFDACPTCEIRETLSVAMPYLRMAVYQEVLDGIEEPDERAQIKQAWAKAGMVGIFPLLGIEAHVKHLMNKHEPK